MISCIQLSILLCVALLSNISGYNISPQTSVISHQNFKKFATLGGQIWNEFEGLEGTKVIRPVVFNHLGDELPTKFRDEFEKQKHASYNLNVGRAQEVLRRELPFVFALSNLDFSIFSPYITVADGNKNKMVMPKNLYVAAVKSLKMAASFSSIYPSMNVKKIEYIEECATIQCLVDVVLPDSVRVDGQAVWEGMFYFGLDETGLINSHVFDRKISNLRPTPHLSSSQFPWLRAKSLWSADLLTGVASSFIFDTLEDVSSNSVSEQFPSQQ